MFQEICNECSFGYTLIQFAGISPVLDDNILLADCLACESPCLSCYSSKTFCLSCTDGYYLNATKCISSFNYEITITFSANTTAQTFNLQINQLIADLATAANDSYKSVTILNIAYGSIIVKAIVSSSFLSASTLAATQQNNISSLLQNGTVGGMSIATSTLLINGASTSSNSDTYGTISTRDIIILSVLIPLGCICTNVLT